VVRGAEHLPSGPALYAANHGSALDIPIVFGHLPVDFRIIHKRSLYLFPILGQFLYLGGHIGVDRSSPFKSARSLQQAAERIRGGTSVTCFPEGTRSREESLKPFKRGSFALAIQAGVPVVPVSLGGVKRLVPQGLLSVLPGTVVFTIHPPIPTAGRGIEESGRLAAEVRATVDAACRAA
jgi:1-acyl-sn-glycerol-3-phosphate acyltransferase